ncbi:MAG: extracellular solute-binding protein [Woeseiaceae bacterium]|nr:extracellular solute-binding protein [Woeseiaceae bacterium]
MRAAILILSALFLSACGGDTPEEPAAPEAAESEAAEQPDPRAPVVVYASYEDGNYWPQFFQAFTEETGIRVNVRTREQSVNVADVIANRGTPPADVLILDGVHDAWRASDEGALRPLAIDGINELVDRRFIDPDGQWVATGVQTATVVYAPDAIDPSGISKYEDLGDENLQGKLCLSSSALPTNRALIAMLIDDLGVRPAEIAVRYWVRNLAVPPFATDDALLDAMDAGTCAIGIVSSRAVRLRALAEHSSEPRNWERHALRTHFVNIEAAAVVRHAHQPERANQLIEWMLQYSNQLEHMIRSGNYPGHSMYEPSWGQGDLNQVSGREVSVAGWRDEEAILLAERARYP